ncbi:glycosyltransferase family 2 protein [Limosilactobacillus reuteri]|uniref:glycosyltransferase family 2 protein n=1 Tax=Limosilactobacillus reuteri TaxID=1598 RepID=UPI001C56B275|nr:glycosyltransferase family 2 protein [Limosilactobacillus reuteri]MBW3349185.1 glycosyltransferase [Limosilactobacillus reuteri]UUW67944.1 glycosyltransferase [Limosilactobacillus reuteri]
MLLSVIIPAYNCEKTIIQAIRSTEVYLDDQVEVIVVNNGSTDKTELLIKQEARKNSRIVYAESKKGASNARNKGIEMARAKWITFLDADDRLLNPNNKLEELLVSAKEDLIVGNYIVNKSEIDLYSMTKSKNNCISIIKQMLENPTKYMTVWGKFYKINLIRKGNLRFSENLAYSEDSEFLIRYVLLCKKIRFIKENIYNYTLSENSTVRKYNSQMIHEYEKAILQVKKDLNEYSEFENSFKFFVLMQFNLMMVHHFFVKSNNTTSKLKQLCKKDYIRNALEAISLKNILTPRLLPLVFCKYHLYLCAATIYKLRVIQNNKKIR